LVVLFSVPSAMASAEQIAVAGSFVSCPRRLLVLVLVLLVLLLLLLLLLLLVVVVVLLLLVLLVRVTCRYMSPTISSQSKAVAQPYPDGIPLEGYGDNIEQPEQTASIAASAVPSTPPYTPPRAAAGSAGLYPTPSASGGSAYSTVSASSTGGGGYGERTTAMRQQPRASTDAYDRGV
jgi:hypothetical protein